MKSDGLRFLFQKEILNGVILILGVLLLLVLCIQPGTAGVSANFTVTNQSGLVIPLVDNFTTGNYSPGDLLYVNDNSTSDGTDIVYWWNWTVNGVSKSSIQYPNDPNITVDTLAEDNPINTVSNVANQAGIPGSIKRVNNPITVTLDVANQAGISRSTKTVNFFKSPVEYWISANFSASVREGLAPLNFTLTDLSHDNFTSSPASLNLRYFWEVGNSTGYYRTSTDKNPQFNITYPGYNDLGTIPPFKYWVNLTIIDQNGRRDFIHKPDYITVGVERYPKAAFTSVPSNGSYPLNVSFIDQSVLDPDLLATIGPANYTWTFDDGSESHEQNPTHLFTNARDYTVRMNLSHGVLESGSATHTIHVYEPSYGNGINFTWVQEYGKTAYSAVLIPLGITADWTVAWVVEKDGIPYSPVDPTAFTPRYDLPETGIYTVTLTASKDGFKTAGITQQMEIFPRIRPSPEITMESPFISDKYWAYAYVGDSIQFWSNKSDSMEDSWYWDFGDTYSSPLRSPNHTYTAPGLYNVTLKASNVKGETNVASPYYQYPVEILHEIDLSMSVEPPSPGVVPYTVKFTPILSIDGKSPLESEEYVESWYWDFGDILPTGSMEKEPVYTYLYPGIFRPTVSVVLKNRQGELASSIITVVLDPEENPIKARFTYDKIDRNGTYGYSYKFMDTSLSYYSIIDWLWNFGDGTPEAREPAPTHMFKEPGTYIVNLTVWDDGGYSNSIEKAIEINHGEQLMANFSAEETIGVSPFVVQFNDATTGNPVAWYWNFGDETISREQSPIHIFKKPGKYSITLKVVDKNGNNSEITKNEFIVAERV